MRLTIGIEGVSRHLYLVLVEELSEYAPVNISREGDCVTVQAEGDLVKCSCIVAICDKYRNYGRIGLGDDE